VTRRDRLDLVTVRCGPGGHWLAGLYRGRDGNLWLRYESRRLLDPGTFEVIRSPRPGGRVGADGIGHARLILEEGLLVVSCKRCAGQYPMVVESSDLAAAVADGERTIIAAPSAFLRSADS
jgi:hypothetical protein